MSLNELYTQRPEYRGYTTFTVVRNPWSRLVSCYNKKIRNANNVAKIAILAQYEGLHPQMPFADFVAWMCSGEGADEHADLHWISQSYALGGGKRLLDHYLELEDLKAQYETLSGHLGLPDRTLPREAASTDQLYPPLHADYRSYYASLPASLLERIERRYERDAERFGYPLLRRSLSEE